MLQIVLNILPLVEDIADVVELEGGSVVFEEDTAGLWVARGPLMVCPCFVSV